jgi:hypothetical protein
VLDAHTDLRCLARAGDGNRTRVLSLGSPSRGALDQAFGGEWAGERRSLLNTLVCGVAPCSLLHVARNDPGKACGTKWHE